jgi:hypothetical protein
MQHAGRTKRLPGNKKCAANSKAQLEFEDDIIALTALAYTPAVSLSFNHLMLRRAEVVLS